MPPFRAGYGLLHSSGFGPLLQALPGEKASLLANATKRFCWEEAAQQNERVFVLVHGKTREECERLLVKLIE